MDQYCLKHLLRLLICFISAGTLLSSTNLPAETTQKEKPVKPEHTIKWATIAPVNTIWGDTTYSSTKAIKERSEGRIRNIWYFGGVMGDELDTVRKLKLNQLQGLALMSVGLSQLVPELVVYSFPALFQNYQEVDCVFDRTWQMVEKILAQRGFVVFGWADVGFSALFSKHNLKNTEDFKKAKAWTWAGLDIDRAGVAPYGFKNIISLPLVEVLPALQTGMVDTVYATYYTAIALQWHTEVNYMNNATKHSGAYAPSFLILRKDVFDALPSDLQGIMKEEYGKPFPLLRQRLRANEVQALKALLKRGIRFMDMEPGYMERVISISQDNFRQWEGKYYPGWFLQGILNARNHCRAELSQ